MHQATIVTTLCLLYEPPYLLLGLKKRGFGVGKWNGFGGKVKPGENIETAARRELLEECGLVTQKMEFFGKFLFTFTNGDPSIEMHVFRILTYTGEILESDEMKPEWFEISKIPYAAMWPDDCHWLPLFLKGKKCEGEFVFDSSSVLINFSLKLADI